MSHSLKMSALVAAVVLLAAGSASALGPGLGTADRIATDYQAEHEQTAQSAVNDADVDAALDNGTVTLTFVDETDGSGVANATVEVEREDDEREDEREDEQEGYSRIGTTDANGTITFDLTSGDESRNVTALEVRLAADVSTAEIEYDVDDDSLSLVEEEYEYGEGEEEYRGGNNTTQYNEGEQLNVSMSEARSTADAALEEPPQGSWALVEGDAHEEDNYYKFEYTLTGADYSGEAEIRVDGSSGEVFRYEQDIEHEEEDEDERENEDEEE